MLRLLILPLFLFATANAFVQQIVAGGGGGRDCGCCTGMFGGITGSSPIHMPKDCRDIKDLGGGKNGIYTIFPSEIGCCNGYKVWCDQSNDGGGWLVFQRRTDGRLDFFRGWEEYRNGFGKLSQEHYLGNELIHHLAMQDRYELRVDLQDFQFNEVHARYFRFSLMDETTNYTMQIGGYDPSSDAGDALSGHNGQPFSTFDRDNDRWTKNCAEEYGGAWWYTSCHNSNLNGLYLRGPTREYARGVVWNQWRGYSYSLKRTEMKMRPRI